MTVKVTRALWDFEGIAPARRELLLVPFDFETLVDTIRREIRNIRFKKEKGTHEAKGAWRPVFRFDVSESTFDQFFNSPYGYRGQYLTGPKKGREKNSRLISALIDTFVAFVPEERQFLNEIRLSLASEYARIWIEEDQHNPKEPTLIVEIKVPAWEAAAKAVDERLTRHDSLTPKEVDRIYGVRAPIGTALKVMGAWIAPDGRLRVVPSKVRRAEEIQSYGIS